MCTRSRSPGTDSSIVSEGRAIGSSLWTVTTTAAQSDVPQRTMPAATMAAGTPRTAFVTRTLLEGNSSTELNITRVVAVLSNESEGRVARILIRCPQNRVIESIDRFDSHLQVHAASQAERLVQAEIEEIEVGGADVLQRRREVAHVVGQLDTRVGPSRSAGHI